MKILHVAKKYPKALGGDAVVVAHLRKSQLRAGHAVAIVTSNCDEIVSETCIHKIGLRDTPACLDAITPRRIASLCMLFFQMFRVIKKERPDVIHTHSIDMAFFISFAARRYNVPIVHTFHIVTFYDPDQSLIRRLSELWLAKRAKLRKITAPNMYDVRKLQVAGLKQTELLPNGIDMDFWESHGYTEKNKQFTFLAVGRLEAQKGYEYLLKAAAKLAHESPPFTVIIVGEGSQEASLRKLISDLHIEPIVSLEGFKSQEEIHTLLAEVDAAVLPSLYETTPLTLLEAWSAGAPVVATSVGILRDMPDDFGAAYIVPPKNAQKLMRAMSRCMRNEILRASVAAKGYEEAQKYTWPTITEQAETLYRSMLCEN